MLQLSQIPEGYDDLEKGIAIRRDGRLPLVVEP
jgi:hypothetical protein